MADQSFTFTMHTLNQYGVPCDDVTEYVEGSSGSGCLQKQPYEYLIKTKLRYLGEVSGEFFPITGIPGYNFCYFRNDSSEWGGTGWVDYYSLGSGNLMSSVALPFMIGAGNTFGMVPSVDIDSEHGVYSAIEASGEYTEHYNRFSRDQKGIWSHAGKVSLERLMKSNAVTYMGEVGAYIGYYSNYLRYETAALRPSEIFNDHVYSNVFGNDQQIGRLYKEALPDLSVDSDDKRIALSYDDLFVGALAPGNGFTTQVQFSSILPADYPDKEMYTFLVNIFNDGYDDGSGKYTIGSGQIQGIYRNGSLFIVLSFDDIRGSSGNQMFQKWYNGSGTFLYDWENPSYTFESIAYLYSLSSRVYHQGSFFHIAVNEHENKSYLLRYGLDSGGLIQTELLNPYQGSEGNYQLTNRQLIADKYIMVHTTSGHQIFFDAYTPSAGIQGEIVMGISSEEVGFYVIPQIGDDQPVSQVTNKLLELCNNARSLQMTWALNQYQVCKDHADWCTANARCQHEGPIPGEDAATSLRNRNNAVGIYAGVSENITLVMESNANQEETEAYLNFRESPNHWNGIIRAGNKYMSFAWSLYPYSVTEITLGPGMWDGSSYTTEETIRPVQEWERGKLKLYVQNFIWY